VSYGGALHNRSLGTGGVYMVGQLCTGMRNAPSENRKRGGRLAVGPTAWLHGVPIQAPGNARGQLLWLIKDRMPLQPRLPMLMSPELGGGSLPRWPELRVNRRLPTTAPDCCEGFVWVDLGTARAVQVFPSQKNTVLSAL